MNMGLTKNQEIKTIITDFDETLWRGIIAEGEKPRLNQKYYDYLLTLHNKGVVLFGLTKNDEKDVEIALRELNLQKNIFVAIIANWESKAQNIELLFQQLELRSDTTLFIDDNPLELNEVQTKIRDILVLNAKDWKKLKTNTFLSKPISTPKSLRDRYKKYRHALQLYKAKQTFKGSDEDFLYSRKRSIRIGTPTQKEELERVAELFYRTNRLNINRRPLKSITQTMHYLKDLHETGYKIFAVSVKDGGESLGIQAAFTSVHQGKKTLITNGTISCSIISFGDFEKKILNELIKQLFETTESVEILVKVTPTNLRIREILREFHFSIHNRSNTGFRFILAKSDFKELNVPWIRVEKKGRVRYEYFGVPPIANYFVQNEWNKVKPNSTAVALGVGQGETLGVKLTQKYEKYLKSIRATYYPIDIERYGRNIVANAENLQDLFQNETVDYLICTELLEHTEHYWKAINEMLRILRIGGRIFFSVPYNYPPHEYPIDKWRLSYTYLDRVFRKYCKIERVQFVGSKENPRHIIMSLTKIKRFTSPITQAKGSVDWTTGLTYIE